MQPARDGDAAALGHQAAQATWYEDGAYGGSADGEAAGEGHDVRKAVGAGLPVMNCGLQNGTDVLPVCAQTLSGINSLCLLLCTCMAGSANIIKPEDVIEIASSATFLCADRLGSVVFCQPLHC
jgi:hypothetical protein